MDARAACVGPCVVAAVYAAVIDTASYTGMRWLIFTCRRVLGGDRCYLEGDAMGLGSLFTPLWSVPHTLTLSLTNTHTRAHAHALTHTPSLTRTHTNTHTHTSLSRALSRTHTLSMGVSASCASPPHPLLRTFGRCTMSPVSQTRARTHIYDCIVRFSFRIHCVLDIAGRSSLSNGSSGGGPSTASAHEWVMARQPLVRTSGSWPVNC